MSANALDVALVSESLQDGPLTGFQILRELCIRFPKTRVIMLLKSAQQELVVDAFRAGAKGVFCRAEPVEVLCKCISAVHQGQIWANSQQFQYVLDALSSAAPLRIVSPQGRTVLTNREKDVVKLVAEGLSNRAIAQELGLTEHTISNYLFRIYEKLGISSRVELVLYSFSNQRQPLNSSWIPDPGPAKSLLGSSSVLRLKEDGVQRNVG
jgi:DNA-binding NarL/FixJ family response regulator